MVTANSKRFLTRSAQMKKHKIFIVILSFLFVCAVSLSAAALDNVSPQAGGLNQFDGQLQLGSLDVSTGLQATSSTRYVSSNYIPVTPSATYYFNYQFRIITMYDSNFKFCGQKSTVGDNFTARADCYYIMVCFDKSVLGSPSAQVMMSVNQSATYEPWYEYSEPSTTTVTETVTTSAPPQPTSTATTNDLSDDLNNALITIIFVLSCLFGLALAKAFSFWKW